MIKHCGIILTLVFLISGYGQGTESKSYSLDNLDWLVGHWRGEAFGGICEEIWSPAAGGSMVGSFKLTVDNNVSFYEFMTITADSSGYNLKLKHFNDDLTGWEEKDDVIIFPYVSSSNNRVTFEGLDYQKLSDDNLKIVVGLKSDGEEKQVTIDCVKIR